MRHFRIGNLGSRYQDLFSVLETAGFDLSVEDYNQESFGGFVVICRSRTITLKLVNDRGQIFVEVALPTGGWRDKEDILADRGISRSRHETINGLWSGYDPDIQAADLRAHLPLLRMKP